jgi:hypothetical protein
MKRIWISLAAVSLLAFGNACSEQDRNTDPGNDPGAQVPNLEDEFGGYTATNEEPGFGDPSILELAEAEAEAGDVIAGDPAVLELERDPGAKVYVMSIQWGQLDKDDAGGIDDEGEDRFTWDGSLSIDEGALVLTRVVAFERGDHVMTPRTDRHRIEWKSRTGDGMDGIRVVVYGPVAGEDVGSESVVTFETPLHSTSFTLSELADLDELRTVDQAGNQVHFVAMETNAVASINGFLSGRWGWQPGDDLGTFAGVWVAPRDGVVGFVRGHFGEAKAGEPMFFGKYIDRTGNFRGFVRGRVEVLQGSLSNGAGGFNGGWQSANNVAQGRVRGRWVVAEGGQGLFNGTWCSNCP